MMLVVLVRAKEDISPQYLGHKSNVSRKIQVYNNLGFISVVSSGYDDNVLTKVIAEKGNIGTTISNGARDMSNETSCSLVR